jgi:hypothetical protein
MIELLDGKLLKVIAGGGKCQCWTGVYTWVSYYGFCSARVCDKPNYWADLLAGKKVDFDNGEWKKSWEGSNVGKDDCIKKCCDDVGSDSWLFGAGQGGKC